MINNFTAVLNGTIYNTTTGVITTNIYIDTLDMTSYQFIILNAIDNNSLMYTNTTFNYEKISGPKEFYLTYYIPQKHLLDYLGVEPTADNQNFVLYFVILLIVLNLFFAYKGVTVLFNFTTLFIFITGVILLLNDWNKLLSVFVLFYSFMLMFLSIKKD